MVTVTAVIPAVRAETTMAALAGIMCQSRHPDRVLVLDVGPAPLDNPRIPALCATLGYELLRPGALTLDAVYRWLATLPRPTSHLWLVEDDEIPDRDALRLLTRGLVTHGVEATGGAQIETVPAANQWGNDRWDRATSLGAHPLRVPFLRGGHLLIAHDALARTDWSHWREEGRAGADIALTAHIAVDGGGCLYVPASHSYHTRVERSAWRDAAVDRDWLERIIRPTLSRAGWRAFLIGLRIDPEAT